jgi:glyoxylase-like metal-dependent hydrolase (beta-lactamase superfamily II)
VEIIRNVYQVSGPPYGTHQNVYVVKGKAALVMVDTGIDEDELSLIDENLTYWGLSDLPLSHVLITNSHYDHCANAHLLRKRGARIVAGPGDAEGIEAGDDRTAGYAYSHKSNFVPCKIDLKVKDGTELDISGLKFRVIHVPGYTKGSVFYEITMEGKIVIFTGDVIRMQDHFANTMVRKSKLGWSGGVDYDRDQYFRTIKRISTLKTDLLLPANFQVCMRDGWEILRDAYVEARMQWLNRPSLSLDADSLAR